MKLFLASVQLKITSTGALKLQLKSSAKFTNSLVPSTTTYHCYYKTALTVDLSSYKKVFSGESFNEQTMPYKWEVYKSYSSLAIRVIFTEIQEINEVIAILNPVDKTINVQLIPKTNNHVIIDPLFHPLGSLLMVYLVHEADGFMIHASGVKDKGNGHLFSAVSGTGKSTMATLWEKSGASIINDDRLWIQKVNDKWSMFSTPMIWYCQEPMMAPINNIYLLRQSPINKLKQISGAASSMKVMANCIQHFFDKEMTANHLDRVIDFTSEVPVYDCGFKPDGEIVEVIRSFNT